MTTPPTRPEPFDPRDYPDPLTVEPDRVRRQYSSDIDWGCGSILALLCALVLAALVATPRSGQTTIAAPRDLSELRADSSAGLSTAPLFGGLAGPPVTTDKPGVAVPPRAEAPVPSPPGEIGTAISSGWASWYAARGDVASVPWWRPGQDPVWAAISRFADGRTYAVTVLIVGFCQCYVGTPQERAIDLSHNAFRQLVDPGIPDPGVIRVTIELLSGGPGLPATDGQP